MQLDRGHLELLRALARHGTLAAAADAIVLSPSAASRRLAEAERRLGVDLTVGDGRRLRLTDAGRLLATTAESVIRQLHDAETAARLLSTGADVPIRLGVGFHDRVAWMLPPFDETPVEVVRLPGLRPPAELDDRLVDLAVDVVGGDHVADPVIVDDSLVLITNPEHPLAAHHQVAASDLAGHRFLASHTDPVPGFELDGFLLPAGAGPGSITRIATATTLLELVARGDGVTIQPRRSVAGLEALGLRTIPLDRMVPVAWVVRGDPEASTLAALRTAARTSGTPETLGD